MNNDIDWFHLERQRQSHCMVELETDTYYGFLQHLVNTNGMHGIVHAIWTMIPWLPYLGKVCQTSLTKSSCDGLLKNEVLLVTRVRDFIMSAFSLVHNTMEISVLLESGVGYQQKKLLQILHDNRCQNTSVDLHTDDAPTLENVCFQVIGRISLCEDSKIACKLLDLLTILSVLEKNAIPFAHKANWAIFLSNHAGLEHDNCQEIICLGDNNFMKLPHSFVHSVLTHLNHFSGYDAPHESITQQVLLNLVKCGAKALHEFKDCSQLCCNLLAHWGIAGGIGTEYCKEIQQLVLALEATVNQFTRNINKVPKRRVKCTMPSLIIPSLDGRSYPMAFELVIYQIVASLLLSQPQSSTRISADYAKSIKSQKPADEKSTPYRDILDFIHAFDSTLHIFSSNIHLFPKHFILVTINACILMVKTCEYQVQNCIRWRSTQVPPKAINRRVRKSDDTSTHLLKPLLRNMKSNCAESIVEFCGKFTDIDNTSKSTDIVGVPTNVRRAAAQLVVRSKKLLCMLHSTSAAHHLLPPSLECIGGTRLISLDSNEKLGTAQTLKKRMTQKRKMNLHVNKHNYDVQNPKFCNEDLAEDLDESSEEDSFQVSGDWGGDSSNGNDGRSESSASLSLEIAP